MTRIVSGLIGKLDCVRSLAFVKRGKLEEEDFILKKALSHCLGNSTVVAAPATVTTRAVPPPPHRAAGLLRERRRHPQQRRAAGLRELAVSRKL